jgi:hypothetical protein
MICIDRPKNWCRVGDISQDSDLESNLEVEQSDSRSEFLARPLPDRASLQGLITP